MPDRGEILRSIQGAWQLARFDAGGMAWFNLTLEGFWRSFGAAILLAPFIAIIVVTGHTGSEASVGRIVTVEVIKYGLTWAVFPLAMIAVARFLDLTQGYVAYIIAYNWANTIQVAIFVPLTLAAGTGLIPVGPASFLVYAAEVYVLVYLWFVARTALQTTTMVAISLVALDVVLSLIIVLSGARFT